MSLETLLEAANYLEWRTDSSTKARAGCDATALHGYAKPQPAGWTGTEEPDAKKTATAEQKTSESETTTTDKESSELLENEREEQRRAGGSGTREVHNKLEKNRRAHLKDCFEALRIQLPNLEDRRASNLCILRSALRHIQALHRRCSEMEAERSIHIERRKHVQDRIERLRADLTALDVDVSKVMSAGAPPSASVSTATADTSPIVSDDEDRVEVAIKKTAATTVSAMLRCKAASNPLRPATEPRCATTVARHLHIAPNVRPAAAAMTAKIALPTRSPVAQILQQTLAQRALQQQHQVQQLQLQQFQQQQMKQLQLQQQVLQPKLQPKKMKQQAQKQQQRHMKAVNASRTTSQSTVKTTKPVINSMVSPIAVPLVGGTGTTPILAVATRPVAGGGTTLLSNTGVLQLPTALAQTQFGSHVMKSLRQVPPSIGSKPTPRVPDPAKPTVLMVNLPGNASPVRVPVVAPLHIGVPSRQVALTPGTYVLDTSNSITPVPTLRSSPRTVAATNTSTGMAALGSATLGTGVQLTGALGAPLLGTGIGVAAAQGGAALGTAALWTGTLAPQGNTLFATALPTVQQGNTPFPMQLVRNVTPTTTTTTFHIITPSVRPTKPVKRSTSSETKLLKMEPSEPLTSLASQLASTTLPAGSALWTVVSTTMTPTTMTITATPATTSLACSSMPRTASSSTVSAAKTTLMSSVPSEVTVLKTEEMTSPASSSDLVESTLSSKVMTSTLSTQVKASILSSGMMTSSLPSEVTPTLPPEVMTSTVSSEAMTSTLSSTVTSTLSSEVTTSTLSSEVTTSTLLTSSLGLTLSTSGLTSSSLTSGLMTYSLHTIKDEKSSILSDCENSVLNVTSENTTFATECQSSIASTTDMPLSIPLLSETSALVSGLSIGMCSSSDSATWTPTFCQLSAAETSDLQPSVLQSESSTLQLELSALQSGSPAMQSELSALQLESIASQSDMSSLHLEPSALKTDKSSSQLELSVEPSSLLSKSSVLQSESVLSQPETSTVPLDSVLQTVSLPLQSDSAVQSELSVMQSSVLQSESSALQSELSALQEDSPPLQSELSTLQEETSTLQSFNLHLDHLQLCAPQTSTIVTSAFESSILKSTALELSNLESSNLATSNLESSITVSSTLESEASLLEPSHLQASVLSTSSLEGIDPSSLEPFLQSSSLSLHAAPLTQDSLVEEPSDEMSLMEHSTDLEPNRLGLEPDQLLNAVSLNGMQPGEPFESEELMDELEPESMQHSVALALETSELSSSGALDSFALGVLDSAPMMQH